MYLKIIEHNKINFSDFANVELEKLIFDKYWITYSLKKDIEWKPIFSKGIHWSISHKKECIFIWCSDRNIWIDLEIYKERSIDFLNSFKKNEYNILWWKNWDFFYILWTAKESVIKYNLWNLDDMKNISVISMNLIEKKISNIDFHTELKLLFNWEQHIVLSWKLGKNIYSICY